MANQMKTTQRGNNRQDVFFVEEDRKIYIEILQATGRPIRGEGSGLLPDDQPCPPDSNAS